MQHGRMLSCIWRLLNAVGTAWRLAGRKFSAHLPLLSLPSCQGALHCPLSGLLLLSIPPLFALQVDRLEIKQCCSAKRPEQRCFPVSASIQVCVQQVSCVSMHGAHLDCARRNDLHDTLNALVELPVRHKHCDRFLLFAIVQDSARTVATLMWQRRTLLVASLFSAQGLHAGGLLRMIAVR